MTTTDMQAALKYIDEQLTEYLEGMPNDETSRRLRDTARAALASRPDAQADERGKWRTDPPPVPEGKCQEFIIAVRRTQSIPPGKVFVFAANYANNFTDDGSLSGRDGDDFTAHGWYLCGLDTSGEFDEVYEGISLNEGDEIVGWQELPKWQEARAAAPQAEAAPESKQIKAPDIILTGAQLLEALDFIAPDRDSDQLESEAAFAYGEGHSGKAMYVWCADYPEEGSFVCDGSSAAASPKAEAAQGVPEDVIDAVSKALRLAWQLGQTYWQQADSDSYKQQDKSDETQKKFEKLVDETRSMLAAVPSPDREQVRETDL